MLIRHLELAVVLVAVLEGDGDHVAARVVNVGDVAVGSPNVAVTYRTTRSGGDVDLNVAEVLGERHREGVAVDGGQDGVGSGNTLDRRCLYRHLNMSFKCSSTAGKNLC